MGQSFRVTNVSLGVAGGASRDVESNYGVENSVGGPQVRFPRPSECAHRPKSRVAS